MSGLRVPVFFGSILTLVVLVIQNRTPVFEITLLGFRSQPLPLGLLVAIAVTAGIILGAILQRIGGRRIARKSPPAASETYSGPAEFQTFRSIPEPSNEDFDSPDQTHEEADTAPPRVALCLRIAHQKDGILKCRVAGQSNPKKWMKRADSGHAPSRHHAPDRSPHSIENANKTSRQPRVITQILSTKLNIDS